LVSGTKTHRDQCLTAMARNILTWLYALLNTLPVTLLAIYLFSGGLLIFGFCYIGKSLALIWTVAIEIAGKVLSDIQQYRLIAVASCIHAKEELRNMSFMNEDGCVVYLPCDSLISWVFIIGSIISANCMMSVSVSARGFVQRIIRNSWMSLVH